MTVPAVSEREILRILLDALATELEVAGPLDPDEVFTDLGLDSAGLVVVAGQLEEGLGIEVPQELLFDHPTPRRLAAWLARHG
ncbi:MULTISPECIES: acyl carrier protein [Streptomyces]|uniref:acyl carrier protein n=1 Tax=Streptomyces TaxID=1883 RepID=UPI00068DE065|nr:MULTISPECIES: acyl carrier protein [Streptomyces]